MPNAMNELQAEERARAATIPLEQIDISRPELYERGAAYPYFERLRREAPIHYCAESAYGPYWAVTKFNDIVAIESNHQVFSSEESRGGINLRPLEAANISANDGSVHTIPSFISMDPPEHDAKRLAASPALGPKNLARLEGVIRQRAQDLLDELPTGETFDWVERVAVELTSMMLTTLLELPLEDRHRLRRFSDVVAANPGDGIIESWEERAQVLLETTAHYSQVWEERRAQPPGPDLISMLAHSPATRNMGRDEFLGTFMLLVVGGNDTTRNSMSASVLAHHLHPGEFAKVKADRSLVPNMVSEVIRWHTPLLHMARTAVRDIEVGGRQIREGDRVSMWYLSGNRDEDVIERPDEFIADRPRARHHLSFGFGVHRCLGNRLAELQLRILWEEILERYSRIEVVGDPKILRSSTIHGITSLPVILHS